MTQKIVLSENVENVMKRMKKNIRFKKKNSFAKLWFLFLAPNVLKRVLIFFSDVLDIKKNVEKISAEENLNISRKKNKCDTGNIR